MLSDISKTQGYVASILFSKLLTKTFANKDTRVEECIYVSDIIDRSYTFILLYIRLATTVASRSSYPPSERLRREENIITWTRPTASMAIPEITNPRGVHLQVPHRPIHMEVPAERRRAMFTRQNTRTHLLSSSRIRPCRFRRQTVTQT